MNTTDPAFCGAEWSDWSMVCELEADHAGAHLSYSGRDGKVGSWGAGRPSTWTRA